MHFIPLIEGFYFGSLTLLFWFDLFLKGSAEILTQISLVFLKTPKVHFEINWPLVSVSALPEDSLANPRKVELVQSENSSSLLPTFYVFRMSTADGSPISLSFSLSSLLLPVELSQPFDCKAAAATGSLQQVMCLYNLSFSFWDLKPFQSYFVRFYPSLTLI